MGEALAQRTGRHDITRWRHDSGHHLDKSSGQGENMEAAEQQHSGGSTSMIPRTAARQPRDGCSISQPPTYLGHCTVHTQCCKRLLLQPVCVCRSIRRRHRGATHTPHRQRSPRLLRTRQQRRV